MNQMELRDAVCEVTAMVEYMGYSLTGILASDAVPSDRIISGAKSLFYHIEQTLREIDKGIEDCEVLNKSEQ